MIINLDKPNEVKSKQIDSVTDGLDGKVAMMLTMCGVPVRLQGFHYLKETIIISVKSRGKLFRLTKDVYPEVARRFGVPASSVERSIRTAVYRAVHSSKFETLNTFIGYKVFERGTNVTNGEFIAILSNHLFTTYIRPLIQP